MDKPSAVPRNKYTSPPALLAYGGLQLYNGFQTHTLPRWQQHPRAILQCISNRLGYSTHPHRRISYRAKFGTGFSAGKETMLCCIVSDLAEIARQAKIYP